jgi:8-hydroxy-5-deazaflavin:NADPH oxidoreductase
MTTAISGSAVVAVDNRSALEGTDAVILALGFSVLKEVIDESADALGGAPLVVPSNPVGVDAQGKVVRLLPEGPSSGEVVAGWLPAGARFVMAFGSMSDRGGDEVKRPARLAGFEPMKVRGSNQSSRLEVGGDLHDLVVGPAAAPPDRWGVRS